MFVSQYRLLRPSVLFEVDDVCFEQYIEVAADNTDVAIELACEIADGFDVSFRNRFEEPLSFWCQYSFGRFSSDDMDIIQPAF